jgi:membrane-associated protease RseP (regulator of RpoE activity)
VKDPLGDDAPPVETRKAVTAGILILAALILIMAVRPSTIVTISLIVGLVLTIMLHEWGHYMAAKRSGMKVTEFFLGFGPRIWSIRRGETEFGIKAIPAGGYCRIVGMTNLEEVDAADEPRTYRQATTGKRLITVLGGIIVNMVIALVLIFTVLAFHGDVPPTPSRTVDAVQAGSPAAKAGIRSGDVVVAVDGHRITQWDQLGPIVRANGGRSIPIVVHRDGRTVTVRATPHVDQGAVRIGVVSRLESPPLSVVGAIPRTFTASGELVSSTVDSLGKTFSASGLDRYGKTLTNAKGGLSEAERPHTVIGIVAQGDTITGGQWWFLLYLLAAINIFLALLNALPIPPLDGGHAIVAVYEGLASRIRGRRVHADYQKLLPVAAVAVIVIVMFGLSALYLDLRAL